MKPMIIFPDEKQETVTIKITDFRKIINDVWDNGYKEGQIYAQCSALQTEKNPEITATKQHGDNMDTISNILQKKFFNEI